MLLVAPAFILPVAGAQSSHEGCRIDLGEPTEPRVYGNCAEIEDITYDVPQSQAEGGASAGVVLVAPYAISCTGGCQQGETYTFSATTALDGGDAEVLVSVFHDAARSQWVMMVQLDGPTRLF